jgi:Family of unknown function (DUF5662)
MNDEALYDSRAETLDHVQLVRNYVNMFIVEMLKRSERHDASKLTEAEKPTLDVVLPLLKQIAYGSPEYEALKERAKPALDHHYKHNSHHPEHYGEEGIAGMDLFDLVEMVCDWVAWAREPGNVKIDYNVEQFDIAPQLKAILTNTLVRWPADGAGDKMN